ncbi:hypothetical protein BCR37DRAFT_380128 [Protomyces lactucae-debilis]|uniref:RING-type E3 ubiquitin transferase n=1 Tax=Protomyces lactucae-debilis TaxID=2754530 RepID=A0A1Y2FBM6_PROLT|nr:uncharacterized protein BCR37DRAFT_380128 [Protomyces lactucae-debilis]ORY81320.1 hypothetical protein BCR37DRAFT_380128 [Protomyces lactucae-debilis]
MSMQQEHLRHVEKHKQVEVYEIPDSSPSSQEDAPRRSKRRRTSQSYAAASPEDVARRRPLERGEVLCPVCNKPVQEEAINAHVDRCLSGEAEGGDVPTKSKHFAPPVAPVSARPSEKRLPKLNYAVLTEAKLRTELSRLSIPSNGSKTTLQRRHAEWLTLWNSNMDAKHPRSRRDLLRELKAWEDALGRSTVKLTTEELEERAADDHGDFKSLIARARASAEEAKRQSLGSAQEEASAAAAIPAEGPETEAAGS